MILAKKLSFTYPGSQQKVLHDLDFEIAESEIFGFLGPSGAGKSTTQKILYKILSGFEGEVLVENKPIQQWGKEFFERIGVGFELPNHYLKLTGRENLELFASFYPKVKLSAIPSLFEQVGLEGSMDLRVEAYSKGMKMRLNFIRALMHDPDILFFDEPTAGLDPVNAHKIKDIIKSLRKRGKTIFITTHNMTTADELCDRVAFIVDGKIRITDNPAHLKRQYGQSVVRVELQNKKTKEFPMAGIGENSEFFSFLKSGELLRLQSLEASLEKVFIEVTGESLYL